MKPSRRDLLRSTERVVLASKHHGAQTGDSLPGHFLEPRAQSGFKFRPPDSLHGIHPDDLERIIQTWQGEV